MDRNFVQVTGEGWMSHEAARYYGLIEHEFQRVFDRLKPIGATCTRKGLAISGLEQCIRIVRAEPNNYKDH